MYATGELYRTECRLAVQARSLRERPIQIELNLPYSSIGEIMEEHVHISISHARKVSTRPPLE